MSDKIEKAMANLKRTLLRFDPKQGRIARRNARRKAAGAVRALRQAIESAYPPLPRETAPKKESRIDHAARTMNYREFEHRIIRNVELDWDVDVAQEFVSHVAVAKGKKERVLEVADLRGTWVGYCYTDRIEVEDRLVSKDKWVVLMHECAHTIQEGHGHRRNFVMALAEVYRLWKSFRRERRAAAKRGPRNI